MEKIDIIKYRCSGIEENKLVAIDKEIVAEVLSKRGLVRKQAGLCAGPWDKYYSFSYKDPRGVSHNMSSDINYCHVVVNEATTSWSRRKYFAWIDIVKTNEFYYVVCISQDSRYNQSSGSEHTVYKCTAEELDKVLDIIFTDVK
jgi:hypothetical protein